jgi:hypothetical protein
MPGTNAAEGRVYGTCAVYIAPVGSTQPTTIAGALDVAWLDLGYTTEDGVAWGKSVDTFTVRAHQSFYPLKRGITSSDFTVAFVMEQMNSVNFKLFWGGGTFAVVSSTSTYTPASAGAVDYRAMIVQGTDDSGKIIRLICPKGVVTDFQDITLAKDNTANLGVTYSLTPTGSGSPWTYLTDDVTAFPSG